MNIKIKNFRREMIEYYIATSCPVNMREYPVETETRAFLRRCSSSNRGRSESVLNSSAVG